MNAKLFATAFLVVCAVMLLGVGVHGAMATFSDSENSTANVVRTINNWYDLGWKWRKSITVNNGGSSRTDFQVRMTVDTASLVSAGKMQADGDDIRFTLPDGTTNLAYWIESGVNTASTVIWVKISSIPVGNSTIYMYYANPTATAAPNNTFVFFDSFEVDLSQWTLVNSTRGTRTRVSNWASNGSWSMFMDDTSTGGTYGSYATITSQTAAFVIEFDARPQQTNEIWEIQAASNATVGPNLRFNSDGTIEYRDNVGWKDFGTPMPYSANTAYSFKLDKVNPAGSPNDTYDIYVNGSLRASNVRFKANLNNINRLYFVTATNAQVPNLWVDKVKVRAYAAPEPTVTAIGTEE